MLRRVLLLAVLSAPLAASAQTLSTIPASPFSKSQCDGTSTTNLSVYWGMATGTLMPSGGKYRILVSSVSECPTGTSNTAKVLASDLTPDVSQDTTGLTSQFYPNPPLSATLTVQSLAATVGVTCTGNPTIYMCVQLMNGTTVTASTNTISLKIESGPPAVPVSVRAAPGNGALTVSWSPGADNGVTPAQYRVTASEVVTCTGTDTPPCLSTTLSADDTTSATSLRLGGLTNGVQYGVQVYALASSNASSAASAIALGTPVLTFDFWAAYQNAGGLDPGGCGGGPAGALALLGVAGLVATLRRRP